MDDLLTERLILHPLTIAEAQRVAAGEAGPDDSWAADYPAEGERVGARMFLKGHAAAGGDTHPFGGYEIRRRSDGRAVGGIGFHGAPDEDGAVAIGYGLAESARGQGYATEAVRGMVAAAGAWGVRRILGDTTHDNVPSQRVMLAAGLALTHEDEELKYYATPLA